MLKYPNHSQQFVEFAAPRYISTYSHYSHSYNTVDSAGRHGDKPNDFSNSLVETINVTLETAPQVRAVPELREKDP
jgi:hypothetical protein